LMDQADSQAAKAYAQELSLEQKVHNLKQQINSIVPLTNISNQKEHQKLQPELVTKQMAMSNN
ncbi:MAG: hypothetical protein ACKO96_44050, partial [Flammeovirgaceae bacterium]